MSKQPIYPKESVGSRMSQHVPVYHQAKRLSAVMEGLLEHSWASIDMVYVTDDDNKLVGVVSIAQAQTGSKQTTLASLMQPVHHVLHPHDDQEKAVFMAIRDDVTSVPVVTKQRVFVGAMTAEALIDIMHEEHIEDALISAGVRDKDANVFKLIKARTGLLVRSRTPWLVVGLTLSMGLGLISSFFEETLEASIALAFFIPVIVYVAGSVGAQASTIAVRALAVTTINYARYVKKELVVGTALGVIMGFLGALGAMIISQSAPVAVVVGLTLFTASAAATVLASLVPITLIKLGKDPALGSGPLATVLQDIFSLLIYFLFAMMIIS